MAASVLSPKRCQPQGLVTLKIAQPAHSSPYRQIYFKHIQLTVRDSTRTTRFLRSYFDSYLMLWLFMLRQSEIASLHIQLLRYSQHNPSTSKLDGARTAPKLVNRDRSGSLCLTWEPQTTLLGQKFIPASHPADSSTASLFLPAADLSFAQSPAKILHLVSWLLPFLTLPPKPHCCFSTERA